MKTTGIFRSSKYRIPVRKWGEPIHLVIFGDVHFGSPLCALDEFRRHIEWGRGQSNVYYLGMGDYQDLASATDRQCLTKVLRESSRESLEELYKELCDGFVKEFAFLKGRIVGLIEGNHYAEFLDGTTSTMRMCDQLKTAYLGCLGIVRLQFYEHLKPDRCVSLDICAHHGKGAARLLGSSINTVQTLAEGVSADLYLMGHDHKRGCVPGSMVFLVQNDRTGEMDVRERRQLFCRTGSFLKGFVDGHASYIADKALRPVDLGGLRIEFTPLRETKTRPMHVEMKAVV